MKRMTLGLIYLLLAPTWAYAGSLTVTTDEEHGDVVATVTTRTQSQSPPTDPIFHGASPGKCATPELWPEVCISSPTKPKISTDSVREHIPELSLNVQPTIGLIALPLNFYLTPRAKPFTLNLSGYHILITPYTTINWIWGDENFLNTSDVGSPYPIGRVMHRYLHSGTYEIAGVILWHFIAEATTGERIEVVGSAISQSVHSTVRIRDLRTRLTSTD